MGWELKGKPVTMRVTAKLAKEFAEMEAAHVDRPLSERRLQVYRKVREQGGFRPVSWARAYCKETEQFYRVNGKHTSTLFADGQNPETLYVVVEDYDCDTLGDVAKLYATFDSQSQTRTMADINRSFAAVIPELAAYDSWFLGLAVSALNFNVTDPEHTRGGAAERAEVLFDSVDVCVWLKELLGDRGKHAHLHRVPVVAAVLGSYRKTKSGATEFWAAVRDETGAHPNLPDRRLAKFLCTTMGKSARSDGIAQRFRTSAREYFVKSVRAWNAWRKGETTDMKYSPTHKIPAFS